ncbi:hypothetical protein BBO_03282 [Beauveria brongniartii RCEF 3172]|uniref:Biotrophy-associated secreted protein 2 n=1 Tax=Beauveria brongniartii RCEF 3172 TaxID=1081107 RepID=A0A167GJW1_9HYPO|nr:hypothetical protein BBO_03282 [Beauveria brongniartii RCEF 3172]
MVRLTVAAVLTFVLSAYAVGDPAGAADVGNGQGKQFITGGCLSDADCKSKCCAGLKDGAVCSSPDVAFDQGKQGCGFGSADGGSGGQCDQSGALPGQGHQNDQNDQGGSVPGVPGFPGQDDGLGGQGGQGSQNGGNGGNGFKRSLGRKFLA